jgi:glycosyltransferase involved in cell wall biosynthesis
MAAMPAYNEEKYMANLVQRVKNYAEHVLVIDDGSTDRTAEIARANGAEVIRFEKNRGKGFAVQQILTAAKQSSADILVILDADSQHNPDEIPSLIEPLSQGFDLVIGARKKRVSKTPGLRRFGQRILLAFAYLLSRVRLSDSESGFRALSRRAVDELHLKESGFAIETEMIADAKEKRLKITQVSVSNIYTEDGSTLHPFRHGIGVLYRIVYMIAEKKPYYLFFTGGIFLLIMGIYIGIVELVDRSIDINTLDTYTIAILLILFGLLFNLVGLVLLRRKGRA